MHTQRTLQGQPGAARMNCTFMGRRATKRGPCTASTPLSNTRPVHLSPMQLPRSSPMHSAPRNTCTQQPAHLSYTHMWPTTSSSRCNPAAAAAAGAAAGAATAEAAVSSHASGQAAGAGARSGQVTVIGAGPAGLATAIMLARRGYTNINVYERMPEPPAPDDLSVWGDFDSASERLYMIGLNGRGQAVLRKLGVMDRIDRFSSLVKGRMDWVPGATKPRKQLNTDRNYVVRCIQRDRLASCLLQELREQYSNAVRVRFNVDCTAVEWKQTTQLAAPVGSGEVCQLQLVQLEEPGPAAATSAGPGAASGSSWVEESAFVVGADGAGSAVRLGMERESGGRCAVRRFPDTNVLVYRTIPLFLPQQHTPAEGGAAGPQQELDWQPDLNYSSRTGAGLNLDALPTREGPHVAVVLYRPDCQAVRQMERDSEDSPGAADAARSFFQQHFPMFLPALREQDLRRFAAKRDSNLPRFSFTGPLLHQGQTACLVGDTIHTVKPYFGQGVNSAFEDVQVLEQALVETNDSIGQAVQRYSELRAQDAEALVQLSRSLDGGFLTFIGPLILDSALHRLLPWLFSPNIIASLQNEKWCFSQIQRRKRVDRAMQVALLGTVVAIITTLLSKLFKMLLPNLLLVLKQFAK